MKKQFRRFLFISPIVFLLGVSSSVYAQQSQQRSGQEARAEQQQDITMYPGDNPTDRPVAGTSTVKPQSFTGTIVKAGDKLVLQAPRGVSYQVDHQEAVKPYEGMRVTLYGTLEAKTKLIHLEQQ